jgi:diguanylate cyclase (GGDEF)-like protein
MLAQANRSLSPLSAIAIDLDHFKSINDTWGHERGDEVLAAFAVMLRSNLRGADFAARCGGEEFLVLLPDTDRTGAIRVAEHLRKATHDLAITGVNTTVTASFGVAAFPEDALDGDLLARLADRALYAAKQGGRDRVEAPSTAGSPPSAPRTAPHHAS